MRQKSPARNAESRPALDRWLLLALLLAAAVVVPRSVLIVRAHSETWDEQYHLLRGLIYLDRVDAWVVLNDPPLGGGIAALPLWLGGVSIDALLDAQEEVTEHGPSPLYDQRRSPEMLRLLIAVWKSLLFVAFAGLVFHWCRRIYGLEGGWLVLALLLVEPTFAAHVPLATLDVLGVQGIVLGCFLAWRCFGAGRMGLIPAAPSTRAGMNPTLPAAAQAASRPEHRGWLSAAAVATAAAMLIKHTALILPGVVAIYALAGYALRPEGLLGTRGVWRERVKQLAVGAAVFLFALWALTLFNVSAPQQWGRPFSPEYGPDFGRAGEWINPLMSVPLPAGNYLGSLAEGVQHASEGHWSYLLGEHRYTGWWYYFPVVASYKVPVGIGIVLLLAVVSAVAGRVAVRPRWTELPLAIAAAMWGATLMLANINIGFRHALPAYVFLLMLAGRCAAAGGWVRWGAWAGVVLAAVHVASWHPNYLSYINFPRENAHLAISDSNIDWGQSLPQVRAWLDENPQAGRPVYIGYFGDPRGRAVPHYLGDAVIMLDEYLDRPPEEGLLILSPVWEVGLYAEEWWTQFQSVEPIAIIGESMRVYDLGAAGNRELSGVR